MQRTTVAIADGNRHRHAEWERLLRLGPRLKLVARAARWRDALSIVSQHCPRVLVLDLDLCLGYENSPLSVLRAASARTAVLLLATHEATDDAVIRAVADGARGYLTPQTLRDNFLKALEGVGNGEAWIPRKILGKLTERLLK